LCLSGYEELFWSSGFVYVNYGRTRSNKNIACFHAAVDSTQLAS
jgi:hypothetical protein